MAIDSGGGPKAANPSLALRKAIDVEFMEGILGNGIRTRITRAGINRKILTKFVTPP
jgi:hypothetical protein